MRHETTCACALMDSLASPSLQAPEASATPSWRFRRWPRVLGPLTVASALFVGCENGSLASGASSAGGAAGMAATSAPAGTGASGVAGMQVSGTPALAGMAGDVGAAGSGAAVGAGGGAGVGAGAAAGAGQSGGAPGQLSFASDVYEMVIRARCASCHNDAPSFGGLALFPGGAATAYANLVNVPAGAEESYKCRESGLLRVKPGDPEHSLLYLKLTMPSCGSKMPPGALGGTLSEEQLSLVRQWIEQGAAP